MTDTMVSRFPVDFDTLAKGDTIPVGRIELVTGAKVGTSEFAFGSMTLKAEIEREMAERGRPVTVKNDHGNLVILTDSDAATYNARKVRHHRRGLLRRHLQNLTVDPSNLPPEQQVTHERDIEISGKYVQALRGADQELRLIACKRDTPGLPQA